MLVCLVTQMETVSIFTCFDIFCNTHDFIVLYSKYRRNVTVTHPYKLFQFTENERGKSLEANLNFSIPYVKITN